jgi:predicted lipoprotein with Yx(FWY)xxD motif
MRLATIMAAGLLLLAACTPRTGAGSAGPSSAGINVTVSHTAAGDALAGAGGKTLYIFKADTGGTSTCNAGCIGTWPPFLGDGSQVTAASGISGSFATTTRDDGTKQVTHGGQPLYYYSGDKAAGDANGQGIAGKWFIAPVDESSASQAAKPSATPNNAPGY